jgi:hypothetical protein
VSNVNSGKKEGMKWKLRAHSAELHFYRYSAIVNFHFFCKLNQLYNTPVHALYLTRALIWSRFFGDVNSRLSAFG